MTIKDHLIIILGVLLLFASMMGAALGTGYLIKYMGWSSDIAMALGVGFIFMGIICLAGSGLSDRMLIGQ